MKPPPPLPVPSRAAIRALRGLVLGTSCTLALVAEDRRRRINAACSAVRNADKLRAARRYHSGGGSTLALATEEEGLAIEPVLVRWSEQEPEAPSKRAATAVRDDSKKSSSSRKGQKTMFKKNEARPKRTTPGLLDWSMSTSSSSSRRTKRLLPAASGSLEEALAAALAEGVVLPLSIPYSPLPSDSAASTLTSISAPAPASPSSSSPASARPASLSFSLADTFNEYHGRIRILSRPPIGTTTTIAPTLSIDIPTAATQITRLAASGTSQSLETAVNTLQSATNNLLFAPPVVAVAASSPPPLNSAFSSSSSSSSSPPSSSSPSDDAYLALWESSAALCRACQEADRIDLAQAVLRTFVRSCPSIDEAVYFSHNPLPVVASLVAEVAAVAQKKTRKKTAKKDGVETAAAVSSRLQEAAAMFLPVFSGGAAAVPRRPAPELVSVAQQLLVQAFTLRHEATIMGVYEAVCRHPGDVTAFTAWFIAQLRAMEPTAATTATTATTVNFRRIVRVFLGRPPRDAEALSQRAFYALGDQMAEAVQMGHSSHGGAVLRELAGLCRPGRDGRAGRRLRTAWVAKLLYGQWSHEGGSYEAVADAFSDLLLRANNDQGIPLASIVFHADGAYRVMVQIALEAGLRAEAEAYFDALIFVDPTAASDIRLRGLFALAKARAGDWQGVREEFEAGAAGAAKAAKAAEAEEAALREDGEEATPREEDAPSGSPTFKGTPAAHDAERVFVPIAKEHLRTHTMGETEAFIRTYLDDLGVPAGRELVTLLANEYGARQEPRAFVAWLEYCAQKMSDSDGSTVTAVEEAAAFSNAILQSCHRHWKLGFRDLRTLYQQLCVLGPQFEDRVTQTIMTHAALAGVNPADGMGVIKGAKSRVKSLLRAGGSRGNQGSQEEDSLNSQNSRGIQTSLATSVAPARPTRTGRSSTSNSGEDELYVAMRKAFALGHLRKVVRLYRHALSSGLPPSEKCLKLAVATAMQHPGLLASDAPGSSGTSSLRTALELLQAARAAGQDTDSAAAYLAMAYVDATAARVAEVTAAGKGGGGQGDKAAVSLPSAVQTVLQQLEESQIGVSDLALNRAAFHLVKTGHARAAIALALAAVGRVGLSSTSSSASSSSPSPYPSSGPALPGYNVWNFSVLVTAYASLADAAGLRMAIAGAAASGANAGTGGGVLRERMAYRELKQAAARLRKYDDNAPNVKEARVVVEAALVQSREVRAQLAAAQLEVQTAALNIMRQIAAGASRSPSLDSNSGPNSDSALRDSLANNWSLPGDTSVAPVEATAAAPAGAMAVPLVECS